jgi:aspartate/methionine/tyrosine aminotransferase
MITRRAIAAHYEAWRATPDPRNILLTASTSEAYTFLFRLLCDPGDSVLVPTPSYPLFEQLAHLDGIEVSTYDLEADATWRIDFSSLERNSAKVRAVIVVHPNNPTGSFVHPDDRERLTALCRDRGWALIADEVFLPFPLDGGPGQDATFSSVGGCLCCTLGGLSKSLGLPQLKLAWIVVSGPEEIVEASLDGLEFVADAYLSVSTPVALAAPQLLAAGIPIQETISKRCRTNLGTLKNLVSEQSAVSLPAVGGGWSAIIRVPNVVDEEELCLELLERGIAVHPGSFFEFAGEGWLVLSLLAPADLFSAGARGLFDTLAEILTPHSG